MGVYVALLLVTVGALSHANRVPYLGGDIVDFISESKSPDLTDPAQAWIVSQQKPVEHKPITAKQKRDSSNYNTKFNDIARAYAEGYKAAIKAVQQRAIIARRRLQTIRNPYLPQTTFAYPRSFIPGPNPYALSPLSPLDARIPKSTIPQAPVPDLVPVAAPEPASAAPQAKDIISPAPVSDHETQTLPTIGGDLPDTKAAKEDLVSRSVIPAPAPKTEQAPSVPDTEAKKKSDIIAPSAPAPAVTEETAPKPAQATENAVEKSAIPNAPASPSDIALEIKERSTKMEMPKLPKLLREDHPAFPQSSVHLRTDEERSKIAKMNARARHRNIYFDASGGDPFNGGGVLSRQNAISLDKKHRRRRRRRRYVEEEHRAHSKHLKRHRRSHMPYLGQNLDAMGVIRATPKSWTSPQVRKSLEAKRTSFQAPPGPFAYFHPPEFGPSPFAQEMPAAFRGQIPQPPPNIAAMMGPPPMPQMSFGQMFPGPGAGPGPGPGAGPPPQFPGYRSMIPPGYPAFYGQMPGPMGYPFQSPLPAGLVSEEAPSIESLINKADEVREKKSAIPVPEEHPDHPDRQAFDMATLAPYFR